MNEIKKLTLHTEGWYDASHHLNKYVGKCANKHGHTYKVEVWIKGLPEQLNEDGILWDFGKLKLITNRYDHKDLNQIYGDEMNSTAENQAMMIYNLIKMDDRHLDFKVRVYEQLAPKESYCEYGDWE